MAISGSDTCQEAAGSWKTNGTALGRQPQSLVSQPRESRNGGNWTRRAEFQMEFERERMSDGQRKLTETLGSGVDPAGRARKRARTTFAVISLADCRLIARAVNTCRHEPVARRHQSQIRDEVNKNAPVPAPPAPWHNQSLQIELASDRVHDSARIFHFS